MKAETKGISYTTAFPLIEKHFGAENLKKIIALMPADFITAHQKREITVLGWYPLSWLNEYHQALQSILGADASLKMGDLTTRADINSFFRFALKFLSPETLIKQGTQMLTKSYARGCTMTILDLGPGSCELEASWIEPVHNGIWDDLYVTCQVFMELSGAKNLKSSLTSRTPTHMNFKFTWSV